MADDVLTVEKLRRTMRLLDEGAFAVPRYQVLTTKGGNYTPVRRHSRRRNGRKESYHRRIQKKWIKRFGERWLETQKRGEVYIIGGATVVVREDDMPELHRLMATLGNRHDR